MVDWFLYITFYSKSFQNEIPKRFFSKVRPIKYNFKVGVNKKYYASTIFTLILTNHIKSHKMKLETYKNIAIGTNFAQKKKI